MKQIFYVGFGLKHVGKLTFLPRELVMMSLLTTLGYTDVCVSEANNKKNNLLKFNLHFFCFCLHIFHTGPGT